MQSHSGAERQARLVPFRELAGNAAFWRGRLRDGLGMLGGSLCAALLGLAWGSLYLRRSGRLPPGD